MRTDGQPWCTTSGLGQNSLPLVLLHDFPLDRRMWDDVIDLVPGSRPILVVELPGFGDSPRGQDVAEALGLDPEPSLECRPRGSSRRCVRRVSSAPPSSAVDGRLRRDGACSRPSRSSSQPWA